MEETKPNNLQTNRGGAVVPLRPGGSPLKIVPKGGTPNPNPNLRIVPKSSPSNVPKASGGLISPIVGGALLFVALIFLPSNFDSPLKHHEPVPHYKPDIFKDEIPEDPRVNPLTNPNLGSEIQAALDSLKDRDYDEDNNKKYTVYLTSRNFKMFSKEHGNVDTPLPYFGITSLNPVGSEGRYPEGSIQGLNLIVLGENLDKDTARGVEQLLIELNSEGLPSPYLSEDIDNFKNSTSPLRVFTYQLRNELGKQWLNENYPEWKDEFKVGTEDFKNWGIGVN